MCKRQRHLKNFKKHTKKAIISDCTTPFEVSVVTDATADAIVTTIANGDVGKIVAIYLWLSCSYPTVTSLICDLTNLR